MCMASMRESQGSDRSSQHTSTITCIAAPRVWHFSAFHLVSFCVVVLFVSASVVSRPLLGCCFICLVCCVVLHD